MEYQINLYYSVARLHGQPQQRLAGFHQRNILRRYLQQRQRPQAASLSGKDDTLASTTDRQSIVDRQVQQIK
jgi:hypothetical protein